MDEQTLSQQLTEAFGKKKAKRLIKKIKEIKENNPGKFFSFTFDEYGDNVIAIEKEIK